MSDTSPRLSLPYLLPGQAQKHVTHNEALRRLDASVQLVFVESGATTPPETAQEGQIWALGPAPTGAWDGQGGRLAGFVDGGWLFFDPAPGWRAWDLASAGLQVWDGTQWAAVAAGGGGGTPTYQNLPGVGIGTTSDAVNALSVAAEATLLSHAGAGHQLKINRASANDTGSLLYQTQWSGRAEMGLSPQDGFAIKVSPDGATWTTALEVDPASGLLSGAAIAQDPLETTPGRVLTAGSAGIAGDSAPVLGAVTGAALKGGLFHTAGTATGLPDAGYEQTLVLAHSPNDQGRYAGLSLRHTDLSADQRLWFGSGSGGDGAIHWTEVWHRANTTVDANGFLKEASPILRLFDTGTDVPLEPVPHHFEKQGTGVYRLGNVAPLAQSGWQIEVPRDANGNPLVHVTPVPDPGHKSLTLTTTAPRWTPDHGWTAGAPKDIPAGRWLDLRFSRA